MNERYIIKRDKTIQEFKKDKISSAILKAMKYGSGIVKPEVAYKIADEIEQCIINGITLTVEKVEYMVYFELVNMGESLTAKAYESYRAVQEYKRITNTTDRSIIGLIECVNEEVQNENSNKNAKLASTQRDLIAGEVSKDIARRKLIPSKLYQAHQDGVIHIHK